MNSADSPEPRTGRAAPEKCVICGDPIGVHCFCKIYRKEGEPIWLCCPSCTIQYIDSSRPPADSLEEELRAYEKRTHIFVGENKPWPGGSSNHE